MGTKKITKRNKCVDKAATETDCLILGMKKNASINNESYMYNELQNYMQTSR